MVGGNTWNMAFHWRSKDLRRQGEGRVTWSLASDQRLKDVRIVKMVSYRYSPMVF